MSNTTPNPAAAPSIQLERLHQLLSYDPLSGEFHWKEARGKRFKAGAAAGTLNSNGYISITVDGHRHYAHRLAWFYCFEEWPEAPLQVDHINGSRTDNRLSNLRPVTPSQNKQNTLKPRRDNTSGFTGVTLNKSSGKFEAYIRIPGRRNKTYLGTFLTAEEAHQGYLRAKAVYHHTALWR